MPKTENNKPIIAVDIDDVLTESSLAVIEFSNQKWGTNLTVEDYSEHWGAMWKVDSKEWHSRAAQVHEAIHRGKTEPIGEAKRVLEKLAKSYRLVITTSRQRLIMQDTKEWLEKHFTGIFGEVHFAGIWDDPKIDGAQKVNLTKATLLKEIGADYLIDDQPKHCFAAAELGVECLLFGEYPWSHGLELPTGVDRVKNWKEVEAYFDGKTN